jgi:hypothetical protein
VVNFMPQPLNSGGKAPPLPQYVWNRRLDGPRSRSRRFEEKSPSITGDRTTIFLLSNLLPGLFTDDAVAAQILENSNLEMFLFSKHTLRPLVCCILRTFGPIPPNDNTKINVLKHFVVYTK